MSAFASNIIRLDYPPSGLPGYDAVIGERAIDLDTDILYIKVGTAVTDWIVGTGAYGGGVGVVVSVSGTAGRISSTGGVNPVIDLVDTAVTPGSYTYASLTVDAAGRLTSASNGTTPAPVGATYITQTPNATLTNEQALSALSSGVLSSVTATGVVSATAFTANRIAFGSGTNGTLTESSLLNFDGTKLGVGTASPTTSATATWEQSVDGPMGHFVHNPNAGTGAQALILMQTAVSATFATTPYVILSATGINFTPAGAIPASSAYLEHNGGTMAIGAVTGDVVFYSGAGRTEKAKIANAGNFSIANLTAGGVVYATAATGVLKIGTAAEVAAAITWPAAARVLVSSGVSTAPVGDIGFQYSTSTNSFVVGEDNTQACHNLGNLGDATYERVRAFWSSNIWVLATEMSGGTERDMLIGNASTAAVVVSAGGGVTIVGGAVGSAPSVLTSNLKILSRPIASRASSAGATLDAFHVAGETVSITGNTNITTATGFNYVTIDRPTYSGSGGAKSITNGATVYIANAPAIAGDISALTNAYAIWVDAGLSRFDGNGTHVFELPADATAGVDTTIDGRIPILVGGATKYVRYYAD